ncbi:Preprotein translocase subunit SecG (chromatophore) [Paulinella micropora]|uniref:Probable protein-export membrane protein SecG n=1 Tax=Paulinella micropora TaxID=1928728 RepID=A0A1L5YBD7_9EUKA|nr:preprotein translocase, SecG subunit [Paulinella micropora]AQX44774.1 preprotein translocase, SecG subunit [Paulinella micropora]BBL85987.1 Preprotein translocase subunit SecG [Paulinella micropora]
MMINKIVSLVWIISGILLVISILLHNPKGDGMGGLAASGNSMFTSASNAENTLNRISWTLIGIFLSLAVLLSGGWVN